MIIIDDLLSAPFRGLLWIFQEVAEAAEKEQEAEGDRIRDRLRDLYMLLETGQISEDEFDAEEAGLLDRLDAAGDAASPEAPLAWLRLEPGGDQAELRLTTWPGGATRVLATSAYHGPPVVWRS